MIARQTVVAVIAALGLAAGSALAQGRGGGHPSGGGGRPAPGGAHYGGGGHYGGGYYHGGYYRPYYPYWGGVALGVGIGVASSYYWGWPYYGWYYGPPAAYYDYTVPSNPGYTVSTAPAPAPAPAAPAAAPEPIYYPRSGQSDAQREIDLRECNRWATTQPPAMAEASVFQRAVLACMDGRGYTGR